jgi:hypothetical protein
MNCSALLLRLQYVDYNLVPLVDNLAECVIGRCCCAGCRRGYFKDSISASTAALQRACFDWLSIICLEVDGAGAELHIANLVCCNSVDFQFHQQQLHCLALVAD